MDSAKDPSAQKPVKDALALTSASPKYLEELRSRFIQGDHLQPNEIDVLKRSQNGNLAPLLVLKKDITIARLSSDEENLVNKWNEIIDSKYRRD